MYINSCTHSVHFQVEMMGSSLMVEHRTEKSTATSHDKMLKNCSSEKELRATELFQKQMQNKRK